MPDMDRRELFPGITLRTIHTDRFKSAVFSITMLVPLKRETAGACALVPSVLSRGTRNLPDMEAISAALDSLYGGSIEPTVRKKGEALCTGFVCSFLDDAYTLSGETILEQAAQLAGEMLLDPLTENGVFSAEYTESEKNNQLGRIRARVNDKRSYASHRLLELMCAGEDYGTSRLGDVATVSAITPASLWETYQHMLKTAVFEIIYCGSAAPDRVAAALRPVFARLPVNPERTMPVTRVTPRPGHEVRYIEESMDVTQGKLAMGFRTDGITCLSPEYPALILCNAVYGGTAMSRLFMNVRERLSLCYYASSRVLRSKGLMAVSSGIEFEKYEAARNEILAQLDAVRRGEFTEDELAGARAITIGHLRSSLDDQNRMEDYWLSQAAAGLETGPGDLIAALEKVTAEDVAAVARRLQLDTVYFLKGKEEN